ncbi:O-antigen ligase family protein [Xylophilus sp.]|uniref:O-antigen ligase family protein n=1 Tax=Xylophilus sp. TaxID=2653893 RepID=UPI0013B9CC03|nr:O-antigen ligase family protein [Xylophilus sp.]KAF1050318.1 MAG: hypothetical protein GAK38_00344 [Xylophilus sp.]
MDRIRRYFPSDPRAARDVFFTLFAGIACAATPAMALVAPSGYSTGAALLFAGVLLSLPQWRRPLLPHPAWRWVIASFVVMGISWQVDSLLSHAGLRGADKPAKYLLALICLFFVAQYRPGVRWLWGGTAAGAIGAGVTAIVQLVRAPSLAASRAEGFTNAIQFGNLALLMAGICAIGLALPAPWQRTAGWRALLGLGLAFGVAASLLSWSRGGWLGLAFVLPLLLIAAWPRVNGRRVALVALVAAACVLAAWSTPQLGLRDRVDLVRTEAELYQDRHEADTSVGQRLEHWRLAWRLGTERPVVGWTQRGYTEEKQRLVAAGEYSPFILQFNHAHNEFLDLFAKRGLVGLAALLFLYAVPIALFWPRRAALEADGPDADLLGLRLAALSVPLAYIGFGLTQGFIGHNSGTMFFLFYTLAAYGCLWGRKTAHTPRP